MQSTTIVTEMPGLHVTVVNGIHEITCERGVVRIWTYEDRKIGDVIERRINGDSLMALEDLVSMLDHIRTFLQTVSSGTRVEIMSSLVPH